MNITSSDKFCDGKYPYKKDMKDDDYEKQKAKLQVELLKVQRWAKETGQKLLRYLKVAMPLARVAPSSVSWNTSTLEVLASWRSKNV